MFFREINGADQSKRLNISGNEGFIPTNHSLRPRLCIGGKRRKKSAWAKKNIGEGSEPRGSLEKGNHSRSQSFDPFGQRRNRPRR